MSNPYTKEEIAWHRSLLAPMDDLRSKGIKPEDCAAFERFTELERWVATYDALSARVAKLEAALTTAYDLVAEAIGTPQYDFRTRAKACVESCRETLLNRAALEDPK